MVASGGGVVDQNDILDFSFRSVKQKLGFSIQLRNEQNVAVNCLLDGIQVIPHRKHKDFLQNLQYSFNVFFREIK